MKASVLNDDQWSRLERNSQILHRTIWAMMRFTSCRVSTAIALTVDDVYAGGIPRDAIYFSKEILKGKLNSLTIPISDRLRQYLEAYDQPATGWLFPSPVDGDRPISYPTVINYMKSQASKNGLGELQVTPHSCRRSALTHLCQQGIDLRTIQAISGHRSLRSLQEYLDANPVKVLNALNAL